MIQDQLTPNQRVRLEALAQSVTSNHGRGRPAAGVTADAQAFAAFVLGMEKATSDRVRVREVDGGAVLDVPRDLAKTLIEFGWQPPVDTAAGE